jgi:farnesyl diphosphate synthase
LGVPAATRVEMVRTLAHASGARGMAGGQALDLAAAGREISLAELESLHIHKTGALIRASVRLGMLAASDVPTDAVRRLDRYAKCVGLAFQIHDDILDVTGETAVIGKTRGKDLTQRKSTYPALLGLAGAREKRDLLIEEASAALASLDARADPLRWLAEYVARRDR